MAQLSTAPRRFYRVSRVVAWARLFRMLCGFVCFTYAIITSALMIYRDDLFHDFEVYLPVSYSLFNVDDPWTDFALDG